jgi:hypothetical protein
MLAAEIRAAYFAELSGRYRRLLGRLVLGSLLLSSGAFLTLVPTVVPARLGWIKPSLALLAAALSFWSLVAKNERSAIDTADLHFRWNMLAIEHEGLWADIYSEHAADHLAELRRREAELSKSSTAFPDDQALMERCQDNVVMHHQSEAHA